VVAQAKNKKMEKVEKRKKAALELRMRTG